MDLRTPESLKSAIDSAISRRLAEGNIQNWRLRLADYISWAQSADAETRKSKEFQKRLWDENPVSAIGQGHISIDKAIENLDFRQFIATLFDIKLPAGVIESAARIQEIYEDVLSRVTEFTDRQPRLKILRVLAVIFPEHFTTITRGASLRNLHKAMFGSEGKKNIPTMSYEILDRIRNVCGSDDASIAGVVDRMTIPWALFEDYLEKSDDETVVLSPTTGEAKLVPMPAARRRRGLLSMGGYLNTLSAILEFVKDGAQKDDLIEHIRSIHPQLKPSTLSTRVNALIAEWGALKNENGIYRLTERADAFLESGDPHEFAAWLLTRILGFDNALYFLRENGPQTQKAMYSDQKKVNPGLTSDFAPSAMMAWLRELKLVVVSTEGVFTLTDEGQQWANEIHWVPECLDALPAAVDGLIPITAISGVNTVAPLSLSKIIPIVNEHGKFDDKLIARLHHGLWSRPLRHFAVLAGLSGAGKTLLAHSYARALAEDPTQPDTNVLVIPVQPGWYDPTPLLGYVNPFDSDSYQRTPFLDLLMTAVQDPTQPYTVILDEMNLSHPEQYLAPLLSTMETGGKISLHSSGDDLDGVPPNIPYPQNLVLIGTVNMDETTHAISDKVLDRAFVMEFWDVDVAACPAWEKIKLADAQRESVKAALIALTNALRPVRMHFGWRLIEDLLGYLLSATGSDVLDATTALDSAIFSKVLPKLRGEDTPRLRQAFEATLAALQAANLPESAYKVAELLDDLKHTGSARFWR